MPAINLPVLMTSLAMELPFMVGIEVSKFTFTSMVPQPLTKELSQVPAATMDCPMMGTSAACEAVEGWLVKVTLNWVLIESHLLSNKELLPHYPWAERLFSFIIFYKSLKANPATTVGGNAAINKPSG